METVLRLAAARERALMHAVERGYITPTSADVEDKELESIITDVFELNGLPVEQRGVISSVGSGSPAEGWVKINGSDDHSTSHQAGSSCPVLKTPRAPSTTAGGATTNEKVASKNKGKGKDK